MSSPEAPARPSRFGRFFWRDPNTQFLILAGGRPAGRRRRHRLRFGHWLTRLLVGIDDISGAESVEPRCACSPAAGPGRRIIARFFGERG
jgi:hypothetical protein